MSAEPVGLEMLASNCPAIRAWQQRKEERRKAFSGSPCEREESDSYIDGKVEKIETAAEHIGCSLLAKVLPGAEIPVPEFGSEEWRVFVGACPAAVAASKQNS